MKSKANPQRRAEAAVRPVPRRQRPNETCAAGYDYWDEEKQVHVWQPVKGPHLSTVRKQHARCKSGVVGISFSVFAKDKGRAKHRYWIVNLGSTSRSFNIDTLGPREAWRRAVKLRAQHELAVAAKNAEILKARKKTGDSK